MNFSTVWKVFFEITYNAKYSKTNNYAIISFASSFLFVNLYRYSLVSHSCGSIYCKRNIFLVKLVCSFFFNYYIKEFNCYLLD